MPTLEERAREHCGCYVCLQEGGICRDAEHYVMFARPLIRETRDAASDRVRTTEIMFEGKKGVVHFVQDPLADAVSQMPLPGDGG